MEEKPSKNADAVRNSSEPDVGGPEVRSVARVESYRDRIRYARLGYSTVPPWRLLRSRRAVLMDRGGARGMSYAELEACLGQRYGREKAVSRDDHVCD